jgi:holin-like protein
MISGLLQILLFQGLGEIISKLLLPFLPGPVIGLVLLLLWLLYLKDVNASLAMVGDAFSRYLGLLFVPAAVGIILFIPQLQNNALTIVTALIVSAVLSAFCSALVLKWLSPKEGQEK